MSYQGTLTLEEIAELIHEYHGLIRKGYLPGGSSEASRLSRVSYILSQITLTGEQIMGMQELDPLVLGDNDVKRSTYYQELKEEHDKLGARYERLEKRYHILARKIEELLGSDPEIKDLLERQRKEAERERYN